MIVSRPIIRLTSAAWRFQASAAAKAGCHAATLRRESKISESSCLWFGEFWKKTKQKTGDRSQRQKKPAPPVEIGETLLGLTIRGSSGHAAPDLEDFARPITPKEVGARRLREDARRRGKIPSLTARNSGVQGEGLIRNVATAEELEAARVLANRRDFDPRPAGGRRAAVSACDAEPEAFRPKTGRAAECHLRSGPLRRS